MSHTGKTRPVWVKVHDRPSYLDAAHDHRGGVCDLPDRPHLRGPDEARTGCEWVQSALFSTSPSNRCGCRMCTQQIARKAGARRSRSAGRGYARDGWRDEH